MDDLAHRIAEQQFARDLEAAWRAEKIALGFIAAAISVLCVVAGLVWAGWLQ